MTLPTRALVRASLTATALCGATLLFSSGASGAPADGLLPGVSIPPVTLPTLPPAPVPLPTLPPGPPKPTAPTPAVPATPTIPTPPNSGLPTPTIPSVPGLPGGGSTPTTPPVVTIPDVPGVGIELCGKVEVGDQTLIDTCVKDGATTATTTPGKKATSTTAKPSTTAKTATASTATESSSSSGGSGGSLARTGSDIGTPVAAGATLVALGGLAFAASRLFPRLLGRATIR